MKRIFTNIQFIKITAFCIAVMLAYSAHAQTTKTVAGPGADYTTIKEAFDAINSGSITGSITLTITGNTSETASATLNASGAGSSSYTDITIKPDGGAQRIISGTIAGAVVYFNGADNVTIDGLNSGGNSLIIQNTSTSNAASTITFDADATYNTIKECTVLGSVTPTLSSSDLAQSTSTRGVIYFGASASSVGNSYNTIQTCHIGPYSTNLPWSLIYSYGNASYPNQNTISDNTLYDFHYNFGGTSLNNRIAAIFLSGNNNQWSISGNRVYQSASRTQSGYGNRTSVILAQSGQGHTIAGNIIGGSSSDNSGTMTYTGGAWSFYAIETTGLGTDNKTTISGNTLKNLSFTTNVDQNYANTSRPRFTAILVEAGYYDIIGNQIGSGDVDASISPSISITASGSTYSNFIGFIWENNSEVTIDNISDNQMGGIKVTSSNLGRVSSPHTFATGIYTYYDYIGNINNNTIGSLTTSNNIYFTGDSPSIAFGFIGIYNYFSPAGSPVLSVSGNTIANISMNVTGTLYPGVGYMSGIWYRANSQATVNNNTVSGLSTNFGTATTNGYNGEIKGITLNNTFNTECSGNIIRLLNSEKNSVYGLIVTGNTAGTNLTISGNFISELSAAYYIYGIESGWNTVGDNTIKNNIISIHRDVSQYTYGIVSNYSVNLYYNTIYLSGSSTGTVPTTCIILWNYDAARPVILKDNILYNNRTRTSGTAYNYCLWLRKTIEGLTLDYNDYYAPNTGGAIAGIGNPATNYLTLANFQTATSQDANSVNSDPSLASAGGTYASDYLPQNPQTGVAITGMTTDYYGATRTLPIMGAIEISGPLWDGSTSTDWNTTANWATNAVPETGTNANIPGNLVNYPVIGTDVQATCNNLNVMSDATLTINSGGSLITNGTITNSGTISMLRAAEESNWHLIAIPTTGITANSFLGDYLQEWDEENSDWIDIVDPETGLNTNQGYALWPTPDKAATTYTFTGTPLTGEQSFPLSYHNQSGSDADGFNLVGNPYPSSINWAGLTGTYGFAYIWDPSASAGAGDYLEWNSGDIAPMQGFLIYTTNDGSNFTVNNSNRSHGGTYYKNSINENYLVLFGSNGIYQDEIYVCFNNEASEAFHLTEDAWKVKSEGEGISQIWTTGSDGNFAFDIRPETETIQLGFANSVTGIYSIGIKEIADIPEAYLEDTKTNKFHNLQTGDYEFGWDPEMDDESRFILHFKAVGINETISESNILIYASNNQIFIKGAEKGHLTVSDIMGRIVLEEAISIVGLLAIPVNLQTGVYMVMVSNGSEIKTEKVFIK